MKLFDRNTFLLLLDTQTLYADKIGFEQMIDNLLNNAMKYSERTSVITLRFNNNILSIKDQGIGIDEAQLVQIFERYYQADTQRQGEGIGLTLVKAYCDEMGIEITIHSIKGQGTTVLLNLQNILQEQS